MDNGLTSSDALQIADMFHAISEDENLLIALRIMPSYKMDNLTCALADLIDYLTYVSEGN